MIRLNENKNTIKNWRCLSTTLNVSGKTTDNLSGEIAGNKSGDKAGNLSGNITGKIAGNLLGNITGNKANNLSENVTGNKAGNLSGNIIGKIAGNLSGNIKGCTEGSITVEAAFVMPIVILTIFALIYLSFLLYDQNHIQGGVDKVLHNTCITVKHDVITNTGMVDYEKIDDRGVFYFLTRDTKQDNTNLENYLHQELEEGLFQFEISEIKAEVGAFQINVEVLARSKIKLPFFQGLFRQFTYSKTFASAPIHNPADTIRIAEVILETGSNIKGIEELKNILDSLIGTKE